jgi:hypothetical protein
MCFLFVAWQSVAITSDLPTLRWFGSSRPKLASRSASAPECCCSPRAISRRAEHTADCVDAIYSICKGRWLPEQAPDEIASPALDHFGAHEARL